MKIQYKTTNSEWEDAVTLNVDSLWSEGGILYLFEGTKCYKIDLSIMEIRSI
jgi:hypothetical protein